MTATPPLRGEPDEPIGELFRDVLDLASEAVDRIDLDAAYQRVTGLPRASITCPECGRTSFNPNDVRERYCGNCHWWTSDPVVMAARRRALAEEGVDPVGGDELDQLFGEAEQVAAAVMPPERVAQGLAEIVDAAPLPPADRGRLLRRWAQYMGPITPDVESAVQRCDEQDLQFLDAMLDDAAERWRTLPPELRGLVLPDLPPASKARPVEELSWARGVYFRRDGSQIPEVPGDRFGQVMTWARTYENFDRERRVESSVWRYRGRRWVHLSTVFNGTCANFEGYPKLWETALLPGPVQIWRWTSEEQGVAAHMAMLEAFVGRRRARRITAAERRARARRMRRVQRATPAPWRVKGGRRG